MRQDGDFIRFPVKEPPGRVVVLGRLMSIRAKIVGSGKRARIRPNGLYVCTDKSRHGLWFLPGSGKVKKIATSSSLGGLGEAFHQFHGPGAVPTEEIRVWVPETPDELRAVAEVESFVYLADTEDSSREGILYEHEVGDTGSRKVGTKIWVCNGSNGRGRHFVTQGSEAYPVVNRRGVVG